MKEVEAEDAKKYAALNTKYKDLLETDADTKKEAASEELTLEQKIQTLSTTNQAVAKSFLAELDKARTAAKSQVSGMRVELNHFMEDTTKEKFDELGEATSEALEEKR